MFPSRPDEMGWGDIRPGAIRVSSPSQVTSSALIFPAAMETGGRLPLTTGAVSRAWQRPGSRTGQAGGAQGSLAQPRPATPNLCHQPQEQHPTPWGLSFVLGGCRTSHPGRDAAVQVLWREPSRMGLCLEGPWHHTHPGLLLPKEDVPSEI